MPKVSVLIPVYNVEKYIRRCLASIQQQSLSDIEIVVVNDATPDNSMAIVRELARSDSRIKILEHEKNMGLMWTRKTGYKVAMGDYVTFCDSDDYLPLDALETLYVEAVKSGADVVAGNYTYITGSGVKISAKNTLPYGNGPVAVYKAMLRREFRHNLCGKMFKTSLLQNYDYQTYEHFTNGEDGCLFYQIVQHCNEIVQIEKSVYYYMQNTESSTQKRLNENAIRSICNLNQMRVRTISAYPELRRDLNGCITNILCGLYAQGYHRDAKLRESIHDCGLDAYVSWGHIVRYLDYMTFLKVYLVNIVKPF